ncbi:MAG: DNA translocase FtsK 4TM domain-containing protein, partial [Sphingomicrobium sp.]
MATAAARARKRDLGPDWREALSASLKRLALRCWGALLVGVSIAAALALVTHSSTDPSFTTAAGGPPTNWLGSTGAYASDALLLFFGMGAVLFLPVIAIAGLRMIRLEPSGRIGRGLLIAAVGAVLVGIALSLLSGSAVSGLPSGWGGMLALAAAHGVGFAVGQIHNPAVEGPLQLTLLLLFAVGGLALGYFSMALLDDEKAWLAALLRRDSRPRSAAPRRTESVREEVAAAPPRSRPAVAVTEPAPAMASASRGAAVRRANARQASLAFGGTYALPTIDILTPPPA